MASVAQTARVVLKWRAIPGVRGYQAQISREETFSEIVFDQRIDEPVLKWEALPSTVFFWRVRSFDADGRASEWSAPRQIVPATGAPAPKTPGENAIVGCSEGPVELSLEPSNILKEYQLELSADAKFPPAQTTTLHGTRPDFSLSLVPGSYSWRGKGVDLTGKPTDLSAPRKLQVKLSAPKAKPNSDLPVGTESVSLSWNKTACATRYLVEATHETPERVTFEAREPTLSFKPAGVGEYRFRIAAKDEKGNQSEWSAESSFRVRLPAPSGANETIGGQNTTGYEVFFRWSLPPQTVGALLEVTATDNFKDATGTAVTTSNLRLTLKAGRYQWRVVAHDAAGHLSFPSEVRKFSIADPRVPPESVSILFPLANSYLDRLSDGVVGITWSETMGAASYELQVDGQSELIDVPPTRVPLADGKHTVVVRAIGASGLKSTWSDPVTFSFGFPRATSAKVAFSVEPLRCDGQAETAVTVRLLDARGHVVLGKKPTFAVDCGSIGQAAAQGDSWVAHWSAPAVLPAAHRGTLTISERELVLQQPLELSPAFPSWSLGVGAGTRFNLDKGIGPSGALSLAFRLLPGGGRFTAQLRAGIYRGTGSEELLVPSLSLLLGVHLDFGPWMVRGLVGPAGLATFVTRGAAHPVSISPSLEATLAAGRRLGPGAIELEGGYLLGNAGGFAATLGYRFDL